MSSHLRGGGSPGLGWDPGSSPITSPVGTSLLRASHSSSINGEGVMGKMLPSSRLLRSDDLTCARNATVPEAMGSIGNDLSLFQVHVAL